MRVDELVTESIYSYSENLLPPGLARKGPRGVMHFEGPING